MLRQETLHGVPDFLDGIRRHDTHRGLRSGLDVLRLDLGDLPLDRCLRTGQQTKERGLLLLLIVVHEFLQHSYN